MTFWNNPNTPVINGGIVNVYVNVKDRVIFSDCVAITVPSDRGSVFRQFENKGFVAWNKIGPDYPMEQIPDKRMPKQP
jgi:hypothetical protein